MGLSSTFLTLAHSTRLITILLHHEEMSPTPYQSSSRLSIIFIKDCNVPMSKGKLITRGILYKGVLFGIRAHGWLLCYA